MADLVINGQSIKLDEEGYLASLEDWTEQVGEAFAHTLELDLTEAHWDVIHAMRSFYDTFQLSPAMRPFIKYIRQQLGQEKSTSLYLMTLFPGDGSPVKRIALIAGLPKPDNCL